MNGRAPSAEGGLYGLLAEFENPEQLVHAAGRIRDAGYSRWECFSPFPVHGLERAMGLRDTKLPWVVIVAGATGTATAILMQWWMNAVDYPLNIGGKPLFSLPAQIPIGFELTVLFAAIASFVAMFAFNDLPRFYHPTFRSQAFRRATADRFFVAIEARDPRFDAQTTEGFLLALGSRSVERLAP